MFKLFRSTLSLTVLRNTFSTSSRQLISNSPSLYFLQIKSIPCVHENSLNLQQHRYKSKKKKQAQQEEESETDEDESKGAEEDIIDKHTKVTNILVPSMRLDLVLKSGLGISRNKVEELFYESKIRVNGQKVIKKSEYVNEGDELDVIKGVSSTNTNFLSISRIEIIHVGKRGDNFSVKIRRSKSLTIDNEEAKS